MICSRMLSWDGVQQALEPDPRAVCVLNTNFMSLCQFPLLTFTMEAMCSKETLPLSEKLPCELTHWQDHLPLNIPPQH